MNFTAEQQKAIEASGNVLVSAGAGAGKTRTLVERCLRFVLNTNDGKPAIKRMLVVTFTDAAAAEVRKRIRERIEEELRSHPGDERLEKEMALLDRAYISTLHSFCYALVRENFFEFDIEPGVAVIQQEQEKMLFWNTLDELLREHYQERHTNSAEVLELIRTYFNGWDKPLRDFIRKLHDFTQTRPAPEKWIREQITHFEEEKNPWNDLYNETLNGWCEEWLPYLDEISKENGKASECARLIRGACAAGDSGPALQRVADSDCKYERGKTEQQRSQLGAIFEQASFLASLQPSTEAPHPLRDDWEWNRKPMLALLRLAEQFAERFAAEKRERGVIDFHDLEQFALKLLWNEEHGTPTALGHEWQSRFDAVFVDEYQDINHAQDCILTALSRPGAAGNRFLVGDVKQSIYRFRQGNPRIFQSYAKAPDHWTPVSLQENFRSHQNILDFVNPLFRWLMTESFGGVAYDELAELKFGSAEGREQMAAGAPCLIELNLVLKGERNGEENDADPDDSIAAANAELEKAEIEARVVASRLRKLKDDPSFTIFDEKSKDFRKPDWRDMVVLLRSVNKNAEIYAKAFHAQGVPLQAPRDAFYSTIEVLDLCNLLHILDNPLQDIPLVGVLRSPLAGLEANELALIRASSPKGPFWHAVQRFFEIKKENSARAKLELFLERYHRWRDPKICSSLCQRLEQILADTGYAEWLLGLPRGRQRWENVQQLLRIARQFDDARGESLYLFLRHIEELQETAGDIEPPSIAGEDAVTLMSVHRSKGLEFPIVAVADLGKTFNQSDIRGSLLLDDRYGVCAMIKPPHIGETYPSLPLWLARRNQKIENLSEETRVLYVALTRAKNHLLMFGSTSEKRVTDKWTGWGVTAPRPQQLSRATSMLDWLGSYLFSRNPGWFEAEEGCTDGLRHQLWRMVPEPAVETNGASVANATEIDWERLAFSYPHQAATLEPAKTSVTAMRRRAEAGDEDAAPRYPKGGDGESGLKRGVAYHAFLQAMGLDGPLDAGSLEQQANRFVEQGVIEREEAALIDVAKVAAFWSSATGQEFKRHAALIKRELPFTAAVTAATLRELKLPVADGLAADEFVVIQGVADLVVLMPEEIWLLDFKTDHLAGKPAAVAAEKHKAQIQLYAHALGKIYGRPVTRAGLFFLDNSEAIWI